MNLSVLPTDQQAAADAVIAKLEHALEMARERRALFVSVVMEFDDSVVTVQSVADSRLKAAGALTLALYNFTSTWEDA